MPAGWPALQGRRAPPPGCAPHSAGHPYHPFRMRAQPTQRAPLHLRSVRYALQRCSSTMALALSEGMFQVKIDGLHVFQIRRLVLGQPVEPDILDEFTKLLVTQWLDKVAVGV